MKVVIFCGGVPLRLSETAPPIPKPMVMIGYRPILWHVMRAYAHWGMKDFILCLGYGADVIKKYFLEYNEALSNDFVLSHGTQDVRVLQTDIHDWRITFADTGVNATIGDRLRAVRHHLEDAEIFCANYGDVVTDAPIDQHVDEFRRREGKVASFMTVRQRGPLHIVRQSDDGTVTEMQNASDAEVWVDNGFFIFRQQIFDYVRPGDNDLIDEPFQRLLAEGKLTTYRHDGFWTAMTTLRDVQELVALEESGAAPWAVWRSAEGLPVRDEDSG
jgi:glucose-1-phosphate cytidylyltransferase